MTLKISRDRLCSWVFATAIVTPFFVNSIELYVILSMLLLVSLSFIGEIRFNKKILSVASLLLLLILTSAISGVIYLNTIYDFLRDSIYFIKPILYLTLGYVIASFLRDKNIVFRVIVYVGILLAIIHLYKVSIFIITRGEFKVSLIRYYGGKDNFLEMLACVLLVLNSKRSFFQISLKYRKLVYLLLAMSFIMYLSRTMFVSFFMILLIAKGYGKLTKRSIIAFCLVMLSLLILYYLLNTFNIERGSTGFEGFLYKLKIAPEEIFNPNINFEDPAQRWDHWRAYEASKALNQSLDTPYYHGFFLGKGLGSLVDLGFEAPLGLENIQFIPVIHNGYIYVLYKAGLLGVFIYVIFLLSLYLNSFIISKNEISKSINNFISAIGVYYLFTSFIITGIYNPKDIIMIFLGSLFYYQSYFKKAQ